MPPKERALELAAKLREAALLQDPMAIAAVHLIRATADDMKDSLVTADGDDMLRAQGAAQQFQRLHRELTNVPPSIKRPTE